MLENITNSRFALLIPSGFFATYSCCVVVTLGLCRYAAVSSKKVNAKNYQTYDLDADKKNSQNIPCHETQTLTKLSQHVENLFETPQVFYLLTTALYLTEDRSKTTLGLAWTWVGLRLVHSYIHVGSNNVFHRFLAFGSSVLCLIGLGGRLLTRAITA